MNMLRFRKCIACIVLVSHILLPIQGQAQGLSMPTLPQTAFHLPITHNLPTLQGMVLDPENPLFFNFVIDTSNTDLQGKNLEAESLKLIKYFMASMTIPEEDMWVNLSPNEPDRIIPEVFIGTDMGKDLLVQDYILKQLVASITHPDSDLGKKFWNKMEAKTGVQNISLNALNRIWIVPESAQIYTHKTSAFIVESKLKVLMEEEYLNDNADNLNVDSEIMKDIIIPAVEDEVNHGTTFAKLRQIYHAMILATWYKQNLRKSFFSQIYANKKLINGIEIDNPQVKETIYAQYVKAFEQGAYDFIKDEYDPVEQQIKARHYFSGGVALTANAAMNSQAVEADRIFSALAGRSLVGAQVEVPVSPLRQSVDGNRGRLWRQYQDESSDSSDAAMTRGRFLVGMSLLAGVGGTLCTSCVGEKDGKQEGQKGEEVQEVKVNPSLVDLGLNVHSKVAFDQLLEHFVKTRGEIQVDDKFPRVVLVKEDTPVATINMIVRTLISQGLDMSEIQKEWRSPTGKTFDELLTSLASKNAKSLARIFKKLREAPDFDSDLDLPHSSPLTAYAVENPDVEFIWESSLYTLETITTIFTTTFFGIKEKQAFASNDDRRYVLYSLLAALEFFRSVKLRDAEVARVLLPILQKGGSYIFIDRGYAHMDIRQMLEDMVQGAKLDVTVRAVLPPNLSPAEPVMYYDAPEFWELHEKLVPNGEYLPEDEMLAILDDHIKTVWKYRYPEILQETRRHGVLEMVHAVIGNKVLKGEEFEGSAVAAYEYDIVKSLSEEQVDSLREKVVLYHSQTREGTHLRVKYPDIKDYYLSILMPVISLAKSELGFEKEVKEALRRYDTTYRLDPKDAKEADKAMSRGEKLFKIYLEESQFDSDSLDAAMTRRTMMAIALSGMSLFPHSIIGQEEEQVTGGGSRLDIFFNYHSAEAFRQLVDTFNEIRKQDKEAGRTFKQIVMYQEAGTKAMKELLEKYYPTNHDLDFFYSKEFDEELKAVQQKEKERNREFEEKRKKGEKVEDIEEYGPQSQFLLKNKEIKVIYEADIFDIEDYRTVFLMFLMRDRVNNGFAAGDKNAFLHYSLLEKLFALEGVKRRDAKVAKALIEIFEDEPNSFVFMDRGDGHRITTLRAIKESLNSKKGMEIKVKAILPPYISDPKEEVTEFEKQEYEDLRAKLAPGGKFLTERERFKVIGDFIVSFGNEKFLELVVMLFGDYSLDILVTTLQHHKVFPKNMDDSTKRKYAKDISDFSDIRKLGAILVNVANFYKTHTKPTADEYFGYLLEMFIEMKVLNPELKDLKSIQDHSKEALKKLRKKYRVPEKEEASEAMTSDTISNLVDNAQTAASKELLDLATRNGFTVENEDLFHQVVSLSLGEDDLTGVSDEEKLAVSRHLAQQSIVIHQARASGHQANVVALGDFLQDVFPRKNFLWLYKWLNRFKGKRLKRIRNAIIKLIAPNKEGGSSFNASSIAESFFDGENNILFFSRSGLDEYGQGMRGVARSRGLTRQTEFVTPRASTSTGLVKKLQTGGEDYEFDIEAMTGITPEMITFFEEQVKNSKFILIQTFQMLSTRPIGDAVKLLIKIAQDNDVPIVFDPNIRLHPYIAEFDGDEEQANKELREQIDVGVNVSTAIKMNAAELFYTMGDDLEASKRKENELGRGEDILETMREFAERYNDGNWKLLTVTRDDGVAFMRRDGQGGVVTGFVRNNDVISQETIDANGWDTVGAGDAITAIIMLELTRLQAEGISVAELSEEQIRSLLGYAIRVATEIVQHKGATIPEDRIRALKKDRAAELGASAMVTAGSKDFTKGGIDFNPKRLDLDISGDMIEFKMPAELRYIDPQSIKSLAPNLIQLTPITNLPLFLGFSDPPTEEQLTYLN